MSLSTLTAFNYIAENSDATPGLFNRIFSTISDNVGSMNAIAVPPAVFSTSTWASVNLTANSSTGSDYIRLVDSSGQRSTYRIGSFAGGTADGLNIYDESGQTMLASFSKQSIRFYQQVVGPVFDTGGALTSTLNAATFGTGSDSVETRIQAAILAAAAQGIQRVYVPANMYPYSASSVSFIYTVQMVREGGSFDNYDIKAYGASGNGSADDTAAVRATVSTLTRGGVVFVPLGTFKLTSTITISQDGVAFQGAGSHTSGNIGNKPSAFDCSSITSSAFGIVFYGNNVASSMKANKFRDIYVEMAGSGSGGGAIACYNCSSLDIDTHISVTRGTGSVALALSDMTNSGNACITSKIRGVFGCDGTAILIGNGSTSVDLDVYCLNHSNAGIYFKSAGYCDVHGSAADSGTASAYGYIVDGSTGIAFNGTGAEVNGKGFIKITGSSSGINLIGCRGVGNNSSGDATIGSFAQITGGINYNINIIGCTDSSPVAGTTSNISASSGNLWTTVMGYNSTSFPNGIGGDATWQGQYLALLAGAQTTLPGISSKISTGSFGDGSRVTLLTPTLNGLYTFAANIPSGGGVIQAAAWLHYNGAALLSTQTYGDSRISFDLNSNTLRLTQKFGAPQTINWSYFFLPTT